MNRLLAFAVCLLLWASTLAVAADPVELPVLPEKLTQPPATDWLIDAAAFKAGVYRTKHANEIVLTNNLISRTFRLAPNGATVALDNLAGNQSLLRGVKPEAVVVLDGERHEVGGLTGQPNYAFLTPAWLDSLKADPKAFQFTGFETGPIQPRLAWKRVRRHAPDVAWPPAGAHLRMDYQKDNVRVSVHFNLYDGLPAFSKWITVHNATGQPIVVDRFTSEILAAVEYESAVEHRDVPMKPPALHVETDFAFGGFTHPRANRHTVHWLPDPQYSTQVNYLRKTPCLLEVRPTVGPAQDVPPGGTFESFRAFVLAHDSTERERQSLALRRLYRTIAPWITENPLMMHMRSANPAAVRGAIDQCADVGFEMLILSFGSGFNIENEDPQYIAMWKEMADYARSKNVEIGGYSLLSSRRVGGGNDVVSPPGEKPTHGNCPALTSEWGQAYFRKLVRFHEATGFRLLEHDGSYPGDLDVTARPPLQKGLHDSRWAQWRVIADFYKWCRGQGIYLNVPDYYYLVGSSKCGMGYREVNWSLPRAHQVIHTRQNIFDGTWEKTPSMGWMFVPLTQYHGGGAAATIEPLDAHLDHYRRMIQCNLGLGVQACYRGPRLYDTDRTRAMVAEQVAWFKQYRDILESDLIHGRRADGRQLDWMLHVNPRLKTKGMLLVFNPLPEPQSSTLSIDLYYTGLTDKAQFRPAGGEVVEYQLDRRYRIDLPVTAAPMGMGWFVIE